MPMLIAGVEFEWSLTLGNLLTIGGFVLSGITFVIFMRSDIMVLANRVSNLEAAMRELVSVNIKAAEQKGRLDTIEDRINHISERLDSFIDTFLTGKK